MPTIKTKRSYRKPSPLPLIFMGIGLISIMVAVMFVTANGATEKNVTNEVEPVPVLVDYPTPELVLSDLSGGPVSLSRYHGKVTLVNNWATWCPPCWFDMPVIQSYFQGHLQDDFVLVGINARDIGECVMDFIEDYRLTFPM